MVGATLSLLKAHASRAYPAAPPFPSSSRVFSLVQSLGGIPRGEGGEVGGVWVNWDCSTKPF